MAKVKVNPVRKYYAYDKIANKSLCKVDNCHRVISGNHASNLGRHIKRFHPNQFLTLTLEMESLSSSPSSSHSYYGSVKPDSSPKERCSEKMDATSPSLNNEQQSDNLFMALNTMSPAQTNSADFATKTNSPSLGKFVRIKYDRDRLMEALAEMVTLNGRPFDVVNDSGFRKIIDPLTVAMSARSIKNGGCHIAGDDVKNYVVAKGATLRRALSECLRDKVLSLKLDVVGSDSKTFLACNAFYVADAKLVSTTLAVREINTSHAVDGVMTFLKDCFTAYAIHIHQVYLVKSDFYLNSIDLKAATRPVNKADESSSFDVSNYTEDDDINASNSACEGGGDINMETVMRQAISEACRSLQITQSINQVDGSIYDGPQSQLLESVVCETMEDAHYKNILEKGRLIVKKLRNPTFILYLKKLQQPVPTLDAPGMPLTTCQMVERLLKLQEFCEDFGQLNPELHLEPTEWSCLKSIHDVLEPLHRAIAISNAHNLNANVFYDIWLRCSLEVSLLKGMCAKVAFNIIKQKQAILLNDPLFCASLYLDPKRHDFLGDEQLLRTETLLSLTWLFIKKFEVERLKVNAHEEFESQYESLLEGRGIKGEDHQDTAPSDQCEEKAEWSFEQAQALIKAELQIFAVELKNDRDDALQFWAKRGHDLPTLSDIANTVYTIPASRATIPKALESMEYILAQKTSIPNPLLNDVLLIRNNHTANYNN